MKRSFSDRLKAAEKALAAHLEARETHIMRHHALKERLKGIQDNSADTEEVIAPSMNASFGNRMRPWSNLAKAQMPVAGISIPSNGRSPRRRACPRCAKCCPRLGVRTGAVAAPNAPGENPKVGQTR